MVAVQKADTVRNIIVPISVSSLKALYFTHIPATTDGFVSASSGYKRYTQNYQLLVGSVAIPTTPVQIQAWEMLLRKTLSQKRQLNFYGLGIFV